MALNLQLAEAYVQITARQEQLKAALAEAQRDTDRAVRSIQDRLDDVKRTGADLFRPLVASVLGAGGLVAAARSATKAFSEYEDAVISLANKLNKPVKEIKEITDAVDELSSRLPMAREQMLKIAEVGVTFGETSAKGLARFIETVEKFSKTTNVAAEDGALALGRLARAFGIPLDQVDKLASAINGLSNQFPVDLNVMLTGMQRFAAAAKALDLPVEKVLALAGALSSTGAQAQRLLPAVAMLLDDIAIKASDMAAAVGMSMEEFTAGLKEDPIKFLAQIAPLVEGNTEALKLFGDQGVKVLRELAASQDIYTRAVRVASEELRTGQALQEDYARVLASSSSQMTIFGNKLRTLYQEVGRQVAPAFNAALSGMTPFVDRLIVMVRNIGPVISQISEFGSALRDVFAALVGGRENLDAIMSTILKVAAGVGAFVAAVATMNTAFSILGRLAAFAVANLSLVAGALQLLINPLVLIPAALVTLYTAWTKNWGGIREFTESIWEKFSAIFEDIQARSAALGETLRAISGGAITVGKLVIDFASDAARSAWEFLQREWQSLQEKGIRIYAEEKLQSLVEFLQNLGKQPIVVSIVAALDQAFDWLASLVGKVWGTITVAVAWAGERVWEFLQQLAQSPLVVEVVTTLKDLASAALEKIVQWWEALKADPRRVLEVVVESAQKALDVVVAAGKLVVDFASDAARSAFEWLKENAATLRERGIALVISLAEGTQDLWEWLRQREIVVRVTATLDDALTWMREKAVALVVTIQGIPELFAQMISQARQSPLVVSIEGKLDDALSWVRTAASGAAQKISVAVQGIPEWLAQLRESKIVIAVEDVASNVLEKITALWQQLTQDPERVLRVSLEAGESLLSMLQSGAAAEVDALANAFSTLSSRAREFAENIPWENIWQTISEGAAVVASAVGAVFANLDQLVQHGVDVEREVFSRWDAAITSALTSATEFLQSTDFVEGFVQGFSQVAQKVATVFTEILKGAFIGAEFFATLAADLAKFIADNANKLAEVIVVWRQQLVQALQNQDVAQEIIRLGGAIADAIFEGLRAAGGLFNVFVQLVHTEVAGFVALGTQIAQELWKGLSQYLSQQQLLPTLNLGFSITPTDKTDVSQTQKAIQDAIVRAVTGAVAGAALKPLIEKAIPGSTWIERIAAIGIPVGFAINFVFGGHEGNWEDAVIISGLVAANIAPIIFKKVQELLAGQAGLVGMKLGGAAAIGVGIATGLVFNLMRAEAGEAAADFSEQVQRAITAGIPALLAGLLSLRFTGNAWIATISAGLVLQLVWEKLQAPESVPEEFRGILQGLQESTAEIIPAVTAAFSKLGEAVGALINLLREVKVFDLFAASIKIVGDALSGIAGLLQVVTGILTGDWKLAWEGAAKILESVLNILKTTLETIGGIALKIWDIVAGLTGIKNIQQLEQPLPRTYVTELFNQVQQELSKLQPEVRAKLTLDTSEIERLLGTAGIPGLRDYLQGLTTHLPRAFEGVAMPEDQRRAVENIVKTLSALSQILDAYTKDQKLTADEIQSLVGVLARVEQSLAALPPELQKIVQENAAAAANWQNIVQSIEALVVRAGIVRKQTGGIVPGIGRGDKVPALLEPGEYVVPRWMLERNPGLLAALEAARLHKRDIPGFRRGGIVHFAVGGRVEDEPGEKLLDATQLGFSNVITAALQQVFRDISQVIRSFISSIYESLTAQFPDLAPAMEKLNQSFAELLKRIEELAQPERYAQQAQEALERTGRAKEALPVETARAGVAAAIDPFREFLAALRTRLEQAFDVATLRAVSQEIASWAEQMQDQPAKLFILGEAMTDVYARAQELRRAFAALGLDVSALDEFLRESERAQGESIHAFQKQLEEILKLEPLEAARQLKALASGIGDNVAQMDAWRAAFHELIQSIQTRIAFFEELGKSDMARAWEQTLSQVSALFAQEDPLATLKAQIASLDFSNALEAGEQLLDIIQQNMQLAMADLSVGQMLVDSKRRLFQHVESMIDVYRELGLPAQELEQTLEQLTLMFGGLTDALKPFREEIAKLRDLGPLEAVLRIREIARSIAAPERMQHGGRVPGVGIGDKVPALLEPGEFVVRREVAQKFLPELVQLNAAGYQQGGLVTTSWQQYWDRWIASLSEEEQKALSYYIGTGYRKINYYLRTGKPEPLWSDLVFSGFLQKQIELIDTALAKASMPLERLVYRGFASPRLSEMVLQRGLSSIEGLVFQDPAFFSTSLDRQIAFGFAMDKLEKHPIAYMAKTVLPQGYRAGFLEMGLSHLGEREILIPRGSAFQIEAARFIDEDLIELALKPLSKVPAGATTIFSLLVPTSLDVQRAAAEDALAALIQMKRVPADFSPWLFTISDAGDLYYGDKVVWREGEQLPGLGPSLFDMTIRPLLEMLGVVSSKVEQAVLDQLAASWPLPGEEILDLMQMQALRRAGTSRAAMPERIGQLEMFQSGGPVGITSREIDAVLKLLQESTALSLPLTQETVAKALREGRFYALFLQAQQERIAQLMEEALAGKPAAERLLREQLFKGLSVGIITANEAIKPSEKEVLAFLRQGRWPEYLATRRVAALESAAQYALSVDLSEFAKMSATEKVQDIAENVYGLGYVKAAFGLTTSGLADLGTLDVWMSRATLGQAAIPTFKSAEEYAKVLKQVWGTAVQELGEGIAFQDVYQGVLARVKSLGTFSRYGHAAFFQALGLTPQDVLAAVPLPPQGARKVSELLTKPMYDIGQLPMKHVLSNLEQLPRVAAEKISEQPQAVQQIFRMFAVRSQAGLDVPAIFTMYTKDVPNLMDIIAKHLPGATIYDTVQGSFSKAIEFVGDFSQAAQVKKLAEELAAVTQSPVSLIAENLITGRQSIESILGQVAEAGERLLDELQMQGLGRGTIRLYTEHFANLADLAKQFFDRFSIKGALGVWRDVETGKPVFEKSAVIEVEALTQDAVEKAKQLAQRIIEVNQQQAVLAVGRGPSGEPIREFIERAAVAARAADIAPPLSGTIVERAITSRVRNVSAELQEYAQKVYSNLMEDPQFRESVSRLAKLAEELPIAGMTPMRRVQQLAAQYPTVMGAIYGSDIFSTELYLNPNLERDFQTLFSRLERQASDLVLSTLAHELSHGLDFAKMAVEMDIPSLGLLQQKGVSVAAEMMRASQDATAELLRFALQRRPPGEAVTSWQPYQDSLKRLEGPISFPEVSKMLSELQEEALRDVLGRRISEDVFQSIVLSLENLKDYTLSPMELFAEFSSKYITSSLQGKLEEFRKLWPAATKAFEEALKVSVAPKLPKVTKLFKAVGGAEGLFSLVMPTIVDVLQQDLDRTLAYLIAEKGWMPGEWSRLGIDESGQLTLDNEVVRVPPGYGLTPFTVVNLLDAQFRPLLEAAGLIASRVEAAVRERVQREHDVDEILRLVLNKLYEEHYKSLGFEYPKPYAQGGFTGFGGVLEPAGVVHKGEYVIPAWMVRTMPEVVAWLEGVRRRRGYAKGGSVAVPAGILRAEIAEQLSASAEALTEAAEHLTDVIQIQAATQAKQQGNNTEELLRLLAEEQRKIFASLRERIQVRRELGLEVPEDWLKQFRILSVMLERDLSPAAQELAKRLIDLDLKPSAEAMKTLSELGQAAGMDSEQLRLLADEARRLLEEQRDLAASLRELGLVQQAKEVEAALASMKLALLEGSGDVAEIIKLQLSQLDFSRPTEELAVAIREKIPQALEAGGEAIGVVASAVSKLVSEAEARVRDLQAIGAPEEMIRAAQDALYAIKEMFADEATKAMLQLQRQLEGIGSEKTISEFLSAVDASTEKLIELLHAQGDNIGGLKSVRGAMESYRRQLEEVIALLPPYSEAHKQAQAALERYTLAVAQATGDAFSALQVALGKLGSQETISEFLAAVEADVRSLLELRSLNEDNIAWLKAINAKYREIIATFEDVIRLLPEGSAQQKAAIELMRRVQEMWGEASQTATDALEAFRAKLAQLPVEKFLDPETFASAMQQLQQYVQEAIESGNIGMLKTVYEHKRELEATFQELIQIFEGLGLSTDELRQRFAEFAKAFSQETQGALAALRAEIERLKTQPIGSTLFAPLEKKQLGGLVLGVGTGDKVPALLEPGEFVVRRRVAQKFLPELMQLNAVGYAKGGVVAGDVASTLDATNEVATQAIEAAQEAGEKVLDSVQTQGALSQDKLATLIKISDEQKALLEGVLAVLKEINERHAKLADTAKSQLQAQEKQGREKDKDEEPPKNKNVIADIIKRAQAHSEEIARRGAELIKDPQALMGALAEEFAAEAKRIQQLIQDALAEGGPQALAGIRELIQEFERQQREWLDTLEMLGISTSEFTLKLQKINASLLFEGPKKALMELQSQFEEALRGGVPGAEIIDQLKRLAVETFGDPGVRKDVIATIRSFSERIREEIESIKAVLGVLPDQEEAKARIKALEQFLADMQDTFEGSAKSLAERVRQRLDTLLDFEVLSPREALNVIMEQLQFVLSEAQQRGLAQTGAAFAEVAKAKDALIAHLEDTATALEKLGWNADDIRKQMLQVQARFAALPEGVLKIVDSLDFSDPVKSARMLLDAISQIPATNKLALDFVIAARDEMIASIEREIERRKALGLSTYFLEKELERARAGFSALSPAMQQFADTLQSEMQGFVRGLFGPLAPVVNDFIFNTIGGALLNWAEDLTLPQQKATVPELNPSQAVATFIEASDAFSDAIRSQAAKIREAGEELTQAVQAQVASVPGTLEQLKQADMSAVIHMPEAEANRFLEKLLAEQGDVENRLSQVTKLSIEPIPAVIPFQGSIEEFSKQLLNESLAQARPEPLSVGAMRSIPESTKVIEPAKLAESTKSLSPERGPVADFISSFVKGIQSVADALDTFGISLASVTQSFFGLLMQSESYKRLMSELEPIIQALADAIGLILEPLVDIAQFFRELLGITKEVNEAFSMTSANVPVGFKAERLRYAAAIPDQPPLKYAQGGGPSGGIFKPILDFFNALTQIPVIGTLLKFAFWLGRLTLSLIILDKIIRAIPVIGTIYDELVKNIAKPIADWVWKTILKPGWDWFVKNVLAPSWDWVLEQLVEAGERVLDWATEVGIIPALKDTFKNINWGEVAITAGVVYLLGQIGGWMERKGEEIAQQGLAARNPAQVAIGRGVQAAGTGLKWGALAGGILGFFLLGGPMGAIIGAGIGAAGGAAVGAAVGLTAGTIEAYQKLGPSPVPQLQAGGAVLSPGIAVLHAGELVLPAAKVQELSQVPALWQPLMLDEIKLGGAIGAGASGKGPAGRDIIVINKLVIDDPDLNRRLREYIRSKNLQRRGVAVTHTLLD